MPHEGWFNGNGAGTLQGPTSPWGGVGMGILMTIFGIALPVASLWGATHRASDATHWGAGTWVATIAFVTIFAAAAILFGVVVFRFAAAQLAWARRHGVRYRDARFDIALYIVAPSVGAAAFGLITLWDHVHGRA
ncbi:hypothetical protein [Luteimicrobium album]|nr:hypothetical protein [Luteimicrobium album]